jgi:hypothetical protein
VENQLAVAVKNVMEAPVKPPDVMIVAIPDPPKLEPLGFIDGIFTDAIFYSRFGENNKFNFFMLPGTDKLLANGYEWDILGLAAWAVWRNTVQCWITHNFIDGTYAMHQGAPGKTIQVAVQPVGRHI